MLTFYEVEHRVFQLLLKGKSLNSGPFVRHLFAICSSIHSNRVTRLSAAYPSTQGSLRRCLRFHKELQRMILYFAVPTSQQSKNTLTLKSTDILTFSLLTICFFFNNKTDFFSKKM